MKNNCPDCEMQMHPRTVNHRTVDYCNYCKQFDWPQAQVNHSFEVGIEVAEVRGYSRDNLLAFSRYELMLFYQLAFEYLQALQQRCLERGDRLSIGYYIWRGRCRLLKTIIREKGGDEPLSTTELATAKEQHLDSLQALIAVIEAPGKSVE